MRYLLDTTVLIDLSKNRRQVEDRIGKLLAEGEELGVSAITVAEFYAGLHPDQRPEWDRFFASVSFWPPTLVSARQAGVWRHEYRRRGITLKTMDMLVAAVASEAGAILLTANVRDFPMPEIRVTRLAG